MYFFSEIFQIFYLWLSFTKSAKYTVVCMLGVGFLILQFALISSNSL